MKVIVATRRSQGELEDDYAWTLDGELVHLPMLVCATPDVCGCDRGFAGVSSHRATSTAEVADRELGRDDVVSAVAHSLADGGWFPEAEAHHALLAARDLVEPLLELADRLPVGTVVRRHGDLVYADVLA